jgi:hypothetical protein
MSQEQDEQTLSQPGASEGALDAQQTLESSSPAQSVQAEEQDPGIPQKFVGKSPAEIMQAYRELERERGRMANELGQARKEREAYEEKYRNLERDAMRYQAMPTQTPPQAAKVEAEMDPLSAFESKFDEDPKLAIREALRRQQELVRRQTVEQSMQQRAAEAQEFYWRQKKENPDYARREPIMQQLVSEFQDVIKPEYLNSTKVLKALDLMSRGSDLDFYTKQAVEKVQRDGLAVRDEKRRAQSESSSSDGGGQSVPFEKLSLDEMRKFLGRVDD